jgi:hypothetical protein
LAGAFSQFKRELDLEMAMANTTPKVYVKYGNAVIAYEYEYQEYAGATYKKDTFEIPLTVDDVECLIERLNVCLNEMRVKI